VNPRQWLDPPIDPEVIVSTTATTEIENLASLLHETADRHHSFEAAAPSHDWWDWYAAYMAARQSGSSPDEAAEAAARYMAEVKGVRSASPAS
jgi:hypothetical protein